MTAMVDKLASQRVAVGRGGPVANGLYAVEIYHGWKLLEWFDGSWWHMDRIGRWTACEPVQWVGPLPERKGTPKPEFDL